MENQESLIPLDEVQQIVKKKKDGRDGRNLPTADVLHGTGENTRYLSFIMARDQMPKVDRSDPEQVRERFNWYFNYCAQNDMKPTLAGLAASIGVTRRVLWQWKTGVDRPKNYPVIEEAYGRMEELWEMYMMNGRINPASGIFLGKNQFDYKDVQDVVVTPNNPLGEQRSADEIAEQYSFLPEE